MFYMPIFPLGGLYASAGLVMRYWVDKHAVLRRWARQADMGSVMLDNSNMQMTVCLLSVILMSQRFYAAWPFDNQCPDPEDPGSFVVCDRWQTWLVFQPEEYMSSDQKTAVSAFGFIFVVLCTALGAMFFLFTSYYSVKSCFWVGVSEVDR
jgi:hypothetical protein